MAEYSWLWGGTATGDAALPAPLGAPYSDDMFTDLLALLFSYDRTKQGVVSSAYSGYSGQLACTNPAGLTIRFATGVALVDGKVYVNSANLDFTIVQPGSGSNYYLFSARKDFSAQTVRMVMSAPSTVTYPNPVQTDGVTWDLPLAQVKVTSGGVVTITDARGWVLRESLKHEYYPVLAGYDLNVYPGPGTIEWDGVMLGLPFAAATDTAFVVYWLVPPDYAGGFSAKAFIMPSSGTIALTRYASMVNAAGVTVEIFNPGEDLIAVGNAPIELGEIDAADFANEIKPGMLLSIRYDSDNVDSAHDAFRMMNVHIRYHGA